MFDLDNSCIISVLILCDKILRIRNSCVLVGCSFVWCVFELKQSISYSKTGFNSIKVIGNKNLHHILSKYFYKSKFYQYTKHILQTIFNYQAQKVIVLLYNSQFFTCRSHFIKEVKRRTKINQINQQCLIQESGKKVFNQTIFNSKRLPAESRATRKCFVVSKLTNSKPCPVNSPTYIIALFKSLRNSKRRNKGNFTSKSNSNQIKLFGGGGPGQHYLVLNKNSTL